MACPQGPAMRCKTVKREDNRRGQSRTHLTRLVTPKGSADFFDMSMRPVLCLPKDIPKSKKYRAERPPFFFSLSVCLYFFVEFVCPRGHLGGHFGNFGCPDPHLDPKRAQGPENVRFHRFPARKSSPFGRAFGTPFRHFFLFGPPGH